MSESNKIRGRLLTALPFVAIIVIVFIMALAKIDDTDVWWHLKCGELFLRNGWIPRQEIFSYTAQGAPWVDGYLLAQAVFYVVWFLSGPPGIVILGALLVAGSYAISLRISGRGQGYYAALAASLPAGYLSVNCNFPRPALLTPLFAMVAIYLLEDFRVRGGRRVWWLIPLMVVWVNCHPAFFLGPAITGIYLIGTLLPLSPINPAGGKKAAKRGRQSEKEIFEIARRRKHLGILLVGEIIATLVNPYGPGIYYSVLVFMSEPRIKEAIVEWAPIYYNPPRLLPGVMPAFVALSAIGAGALVWSGRSIRIERILLFLFMAVSAFTGRRNLMLFAVTTLPIISWTVSDIVGASRHGVTAPLQGHPEHEKGYPTLTAVPKGRGQGGVLLHSTSGAHMGAPLRWINWEKARWIVSGTVSLVALVMVWFTATDRFYFYAHLLRNTGFGVQTAMFPEKAAELLKAEQAQGRMFHQFGLGGYFIFALYPKYQIYIDGRIYPYPIEVFDDGHKALSSPPVFEMIRAKYDIRIVFLSPVPENGPLMEYLLKSGAWAAVYADSAGALFMARGAGNDAIIQRHEMNLLAEPPILPTRPPGRTFWPWSKAENPYGIAQWGMIYEKIGRPDLALRVLREALNFRPLLDHTEINIAALMIKSGDLDGGFVILTRKMKENPNDPVVLRSLSDYYVGKRDWDQAEKVLLELLKDDPKSVVTWNSLGAVAFNKRDYNLAAQRLRTALTYSPNSPILWEKLGRSLEFSDTAAAARAYEKAIELFQSSGGTSADVQRVMDRLQKLRGW